METTHPTGWGVRMRDPQAPAQVLAEFRASDPEFITETAIARVWKVQTAQGLAALKIYHKPSMGQEADGFVFTDALKGVAVAKVFQTTGNIALTEWLDGPSLGDMTRSGEDKKAAEILVDVAKTIHSNTHNLGLNLITLEELFSWLFTIEFAPECPESAQHSIRYCQKLAGELLASQTDIRPLHGDLHHDNIRLGARGYCAFDAKGVAGERTFELANAFRNPKAAPKIVQDPARIIMLLEMWSNRFEVNQQRLLQWATVKIALSIAWRCNRRLLHDPELALLATFIGLPALWARNKR